MKATWEPFVVSFNVFEVKKLRELAKQTFEKVKGTGWTRPYENKGYTDTPDVWFDMMRSELAVSRLASGEWTPTIGKADKGFDVKHGTTLIQVRYNHYDDGDFYGVDERLKCHVGVLVTPWKSPMSNETDVAIVGFVTRGDFTERRQQKRYVKGGPMNWVVEQHELRPASDLRRYLAELASNKGQKEPQETLL